ncbi:hypothetical protein EJ04DRAFT_395856, partial [Polyplosphaeria fusca]
IFSFSHLSPIVLNITVPTAYPEEEPLVEVSSDWITDKVKGELQDLLHQEWENADGTGALLLYICAVQEQATKAFKLSQLRVSIARLYQIAAFERSAIAGEFQRSTFTCPICLELRKGYDCYQIRQCKHIFCKRCLQDGYNGAIFSGAVNSVCCMDPDCGKEGLSERARRGMKNKLLTPKELLLIPIERQVVHRYVDIKRKKKLESDKSVIWCPRKWCQGAAEGSRYPKPTIPLEKMDKVDTDNDEEEDSIAIERARRQANSNLQARLAVCENCQFAFCTLCTKSWHGDYVKCSAHSAIEHAAEDEASRNYILLNTSPCPRCENPIQKTAACNHMECFNCRTHFCYLCSGWLDPKNPYAHYSKEGTPCFQKLFAMSEGDEQGEDG